MNYKSRSILYSVFFLVSIILIGGAGCTKPYRETNELPESSTPPSEVIYKSTSLGFSLEHPKDYRVEETTTNGKNFPEVLFFYPGTGGEPALRIGKHQDTTQKLMQLQTKESPAYKKMPDKVIGGKTAKVVCASETEGTVCIYYLEDKQGTFIIKDYSNSELYKTFKIVSP